jgi:hypothetical protein
MEQFEEVIRSGIPTRVPPTQPKDPSPGQDVEVAVFNGSSPTLSSGDSAASITWYVITFPFRLIKIADISVFVIQN